MSEAHELIQALNRNAQESRELREEMVRLREEFQKLHAHAPQKKDRAEALIEGVAPFVAELMTGRRRRKT